MCMVKLYNNNHNYIIMRRVKVPVFGPKGEAAQH